MKSASTEPVSRVERRLGLAHEPNEAETQILLVREFRQLNDSIVLLLDIFKSLIRLVEEFMSRLPTCGGQPAEVGLLGMIGEFASECEGLHASKKLWICPR